ncbi:MAG: cobaltochelatase subunit CobN [Accumulibacter sp.]|jgi:cobaltochelatase CobN|uniref:cobaltochelatase subunit CobN n=1 Tax=Accumulibacter sp. TaxID=2053492 RepID=UPI002FC3938B
MLLKKILGRSLILAAATLVTPADADTVLFVSVSPVPQGKFTHLAEIGAAHGFKVESRQAEKLPAETDASLWRGADIVIFDAPRDHLQEQMRVKLARALPGLAAPHLWMHDTKPEAKGFPEPLADLLHAYYINGARSNFENFFHSLAAYRQGKPLDGIAPPIVFPKAAIYHPQAPGLVFANTADYLKWKEVDLANKPPVIAVALHQTYIGSEQTAFVDDLIARIEAAGAVPLAWYAPVMGSHAGLLKMDGKLVADAVINTQIVLDPDGRKKELEALGIPWVQALAYRRGDEADWRADPQGVPLLDIPFFLAQGEYAGITDAVIAGAQKKGDHALTVIPEQSSAVVAKALNQVRLQRLPNAEKTVAVMFWNYPSGEKNLSASYLNLPQSFVATLKSLKAAGYQVLPEEETILINNLQRLLAPFYRDGQLQSLLRDGLAEKLPVAAYRQWLATLPEGVRHELQERWGDPEQSSMVVRNDGAPYFVIPRFAAGKVIFTPQAPRGEKWEDQEKALYHSTTAIPSHYYLAQYLWVREHYQADALVHYGTHGSQEWLPGKERGLAMTDYPMLAVGNLPVIYPYIVDNIGEAMQAKRRGRATIVTHQTPAFAPAGLHEATVKIHDLLHAWLAQDDGAVKQKLAADLKAAVKKERIDRDMGWSEAKIEAEFRGFVDTLHDYLHELAQTAQPLGLHTFGTPPQETHRLGSVLLMLGKPFWESVASAAGVKGDDLDEMFVDSYEKTVEAPPFKLFRDWLAGRAAKPADAALAERFEQGRIWYDHLAAADEVAGLLAGLAGRYIPTSYGGDPMKNPDALPTGRNLYGFDPSRVPTRQAWEAGKEAAEALIAAHRAKTGKFPKKLAFSLWSVETMRHQGMLEAQALWTLGVEPVWEPGGRVVDVTLSPREKLGRPRVDVVLSATGLYRDHFPNTMKQLAKAVQLAARANEADNPLHENSRAITARLIKQGIPEAAAVKAAETRIFSSESGKYGTGLDDATLATNTWKGKAEGDRKLADLYLSRMQFAYGVDEEDWGRQGIAGAEGKAARINLYAEHLQGTEGAVLSRSSNLYGLLTTDDPFQYLGGIGLAVRRLDGKAPELYISNLRGSGSGKVEGADQFLAKELATRNFHPGYIKGLMAEGYAGTLQVLDSMNNFSGWTIVAREIVRDDQWQEFVDVYVRDKHKLGIKEWFEAKNPTALAQTIERMIEAARQGYWQADPKVLVELQERYRDLARRHDVVTDNPVFKAFVDAGANAGFGLVAPLPATRPQQAADLVAPHEVPAAPQIEGMKLERVEEKPLPPALPFALLGIALLLLATGGGAVRTLTNPTLRRVEGVA